MAPALTEEKIFVACRTLFGSGVNLSREFLLYIQPGGAKSAFRKAAKETHPDLFMISLPDVQKRQNERFREILQAYELLIEFFKQREDGRWMPPCPDFGPASTDQRPPRTDAAPQDQRYNGPMPRQQLSIGLYLYYRKVIPYRALIEALVWQRKQRPTIGAIARQWNWLDEDGVSAIMRERGGARRFGERAIRLGLLEPRQVDTLLFLQRAQQARLGEFFIRRGYVTRERMEQLAEDFHRHNACLRKS